MFYVLLEEKKNRVKTVTEKKSIIIIFQTWQIPHSYFEGPIPTRSGPVRRCSLAAWLLVVKGGDISWAELISALTFLTGEECPLPPMKEVSRNSGCIF